jgi:putative membrane protein
MGVGMIRPIYFFILITHILLSIVQVPLILTTVYLAFVKNFTRHRKFARVTFPIWLYVSVTGVLIFVILKSFNQGA